MSMADTTVADTTVADMDTDPDNVVADEVDDVHDVVCPVCLEETTAESDTQVECPLCHRQFHESCISRWVETSRNAACPWCRNAEAWTRYCPPRSDTPWAGLQSRAELVFSSSGGAFIGGVVLQPLSDILSLHAFNDNVNFANARTGVRNQGRPESGASTSATLSYADVLSGSVGSANRLNSEWSDSRRNAVLANNAEIGYDATPGVPDDAIAYITTIDWIPVVRVDDEAFVYGNTPSHSVFRNPAPS